jgi:holliday junction DNA helicase RuvB
MKKGVASDNTLSPLREPLQEDVFDKTLRPSSLDDFIGQVKLRENLRVFVQAARERKQALDHVLFSGPPGLGKTSMAHVVAKELGVGFRATSAPIITKAGDLAAILTNLQPMDVLFINEIHRLNPTVEEILYPAMEDFQLDLMIGEGPSARSIRIDLPPFTLVGATTRAGLLATPLRDRFGIPLHFSFYEPQDLQKIVERAARLLNLNLSLEGALEIAKRSRGTPRVAGRLLRRVSDIAHVDQHDIIDKKVAHDALYRLDVDDYGLDQMDRRYLECIGLHYGGGPVGAETLAAILYEQRDMIEEVIEPYLLQQGLIQRTARGRMLTAFAYQVLGLTMPQNNPQGNLLTLEMNHDT